MSSRLSIVAHAVERYHERWARHLTPLQARAELIQISHGARPTKRRTLGGEEIWTADAATRILFVVKRDQGNPVCVTVLPAGAFEDPSTDQDMQDFLEYQQDSEAENRRIQELLSAESGITPIHPLVKQRLIEMARLCGECQNAEAVRYYAPKRIRWCHDCYKRQQLAAHGSLGHVPKLPPISA